MLYHVHSRLWTNESIVINYSDSGAFNCKEFKDTLNRSQEVTHNVDKNNYNRNIYETPQFEKGLKVVLN